MPIPASIVLADRETTPVNHTFTAIQDGPTSVWINAAGASTLSGQETMQVEVIRGKTDTAPSKGRVTLYDPVEAVVDGNTSVVRSCSSGTTFTFQPGATLQEKRNLVRMHANALLNADIESALCNGVPFI